jgi:hypothetical protein
MVVVMMKMVVTIIIIIIIIIIWSLIFNLIIGRITIIQSNSLAPSIETEQLNSAVGFCHVSIWSISSLNRAWWSDLLRYSWFSYITSGICLHSSLKYLFPVLYLFIIDNKLSNLHSNLPEFSYRGTKNPISRT